MILTKEVEVKVTSNNIKYYESLGYKIPMKKASETTRKRYNKDYVYDIGNTLTVNIEDLPKGSHVNIDVLCDMCHKKNTVIYKSYNKSMEKTGSYTCKECAPQKSQQTNLERYGVASPLQLEDVKEKIKQTNLERYGVENPRQCASIREKAKETCLEKYGVEFPTQYSAIKEKIKQTCLEKYGSNSALGNADVIAKAKKTLMQNYGVVNPGQSKEIRDKVKKTNIKRYGFETPFSSEEIRNKIKQTNLDRYGVEHNMQSERVLEKRRNTYIKKYGFDSPMKHPAVKEKLVNTMHKNGTQKTSRQQAYLHRLYGGELNFPVKYYDADICIPDEKIIIEYDGSGHDLSVIFGDYTQKEFDNREMVRYNVIKNEGYKQIHIISRNDMLPSDAILLGILADAKSYFKNYPEHFWIKYDIDGSTVYNAVNKTGIFYDFGKLRKIKKDDIKEEQAENIV